MKYPKQLISGKDIDLSKYNLGKIKQPVIDDFMDDYELLDFVKVFYLEQTWKVNGVIDDKIPFTFLLVVCKEKPEILELLFKSLELLYGTKDINLVEVGEGDYRLLIKKDGNALGYLDDSNFNYLCQVILEVCYYSTPKPEKKEVYENADDAILAEFEKFESKMRKKKEKQATHFEEVVREVIHMRRGSYVDIKNWTVFQLQDAYKSYLLMDKNENEWRFASNGYYDTKSIKSWIDETKITRE